MRERAFSAMAASGATLTRLEMSEWWPLALGLGVLFLGLIAAYTGWGQPKKGL